MNHHTLGITDKSLCIAYRVVIEKKKDFSSRNVNVFVFPQGWFLAQTQTLQTLCLP